MSEKRDALTKGAIEVLALHEQIAHQPTKPQSTSVTFVQMTDMTPTAAAAYVEGERAKIEVARWQAEAMKKDAEERTKQAIEDTKRSQEETNRAKETTRQSLHRVWRVALACLSAGGGVVGIVLAPTAGGSIATVMGFLTLAVGSSFAIDALDKRRKSKSTDDNKTEKS